MKKLLTIVAMLVLLVSSVSATWTTLTGVPESMGFVDSVTAEFCIYDNSNQVNPMDVDVVIDPICKDVDGIYGCGAGDMFDPVGFTVVPTELTTGADGCVDVVLSTNLDENSVGEFYFTVNGQLSETTIGSETDNVLIPEFGIIASVGLLGAAGFYIARRRKDM